MQKVWCLNYGWDRQKSLKQFVIILLPNVRHHLWMTWVFRGGFKRLSCVAVSVSRVKIYTHGSIRLFYFLKLNETDWSAIYVFNIFSETFLIHIGVTFWPLFSTNVFWTMQPPKRAKQKKITKKSILHPPLVMFPRRCSFG